MPVFEAASAGDKGKEVRAATVLRVSCLFLEHDGRVVCGKGFLDQWPMEV